MVCNICLPCASVACESTSRPPALEKWICLPPRLPLSVRSSQHARRGQQAGQNVRTAAQADGAAAALARRDHGSAELDQISQMFAGEQGTVVQKDRQSPLNGATPSMPAAVVMQPSVSSHASPAANSSISASDAGTPHGLSAQQQQLQQPSLVVFSGGTAFNTVAGHMRSLTTRVTHVLPVSDDGGSTAEIVRVLGGPAVGDIRSRCLRLADDSNEEARAVKRLLAHRLDSRDAAAARREWHDLVEGQHALWAGVSDPYKHTIRAFLVHFHSAILRHSSERFNFLNGSIGNFFFAGARLFLRSLEAAVFLFSRVARIPDGSAVLPAICTEGVITLGAELEGGAVIRGQNQISHPPRAAGTVDKSGSGPALPAPIRRIFYLSSEGTQQEHEVFPLPNPTVLTEVGAADGLVFAMGSLYTSICPPLVLSGVGEAIAARQGIPKVLLLNGSHDRETSVRSGSTGGMTAVDIVHALTDALNRRHSPRGSTLQHSAGDYITHLLAPAGGAIHIDVDQLAAVGISHVLEVPALRDGAHRAVYDPDALVAAIGGILADSSKAVVAEAVLAAV